MVLICCQREGTINVFDQLRLLKTLINTTEKKLLSSSKQKQLWYRKKHRKFYPSVNLETKFLQIFFKRLDNLRPIVTFRWIRDFPCDTKQRVVVNERYSKRATVRGGFFQGSVKGPVLFINFNILMFQCVSSKMYVHADNAKIYPAVPNDEDAAQLRNDLDALWNWTRYSLLKFNSSNCHHVTLTGRSERRTRNYTIDADKPLTGKECEKDC